jgi:7-carboxy-7-deazaguanine synthase
VIAINDIYPTIQGEGALTGTPMVLVRLQGCSVGCPWCDTKETWQLDSSQRAYTLEGTLKARSRWMFADADRIAAEARRQGPSIPWALVTGGEPAEQPELPSLTQSLSQHCFKVAIETSGTAPLASSCHMIDWLCVSPKLGMPGGKPVLRDVASLADEIKMVIGKATDLTTLDDFLRDLSLAPGCTISLQPVSTSAKATKLCVETCLARGWRLSLQTHKFIHVR